MTRRIIHFLNLDAVGGVEYLYNSFIAASHPEFPQADHALVTGREIHPHFSGKLRSSLASVHYLKSWHGMKLPKRPRFFRRSWQDHVVRKVAPGLGVLWNRFGDDAAVSSLRKARAAVTYYEHGSTWLAPAGNRSNDFARSVDSVICASFAARRVYELRWGFRGKISVVLFLRRTAT